jgi:DNA-binding winged helix-turn-helix (wHTH) protein
LDRVELEDRAGVRLGERERAVLAALVDRNGRVVDRDQLRRDAGMTNLNQRRCDAAVFKIRQALGSEAVLTVRRRGWRLNPEAIAVALALITNLG